MEEIKEIIKTEVKKHESGLDEHHVDTITRAIYKQLLEYMTVENLEKMVHDLKQEFINVVDSLIPVVEEYEGKIEDLLDVHLGKILDRF